MTSAEVLLDYQRKIGDLQASLAQVQSRQGFALAILTLALAAALTAGFLAFSRRAAPAWSAPMPLPVVLLSIREYGRQRLRALRVDRLLRHYRDGAARLEDRWSGRGVTGDEFAQPGHLYSADLNVFGTGSLFERICTARTHLGRERVARYLDMAAPLDEIHRRQEAVRELAPRDDLRENIALLGAAEFLDSRWQAFEQWLDSPPAGLAWWLRPAAAASSIALALLALVWLIAPSAWPALPWAVFAIVATHAAAGAWTIRRVRRVIAAAAPVAAEFAVIREGLELLASGRFESPKLAELARRAEPAGAAIRRLEPWFTVLQERTKEWFFAPSLLLLLGTQSAAAIEAWRSRYRESLRDWADAWAEFEALNAIACYARENPEDCQPEGSAGAHFHAEALGHPLIPRDRCVSNSISLGDIGLGPDRRFYVISGSNMAGKSTLLRSIGLASVLAAAGAPVRARALRLGAMRVCASLSIADSQREGKSKFLAEVERVRETLALAARHPVLFLVDEIFSGTNSLDRHAAADAVVRTLVDRGAIGAVSTHDITLTGIAAHGGANVHMASREGSNDPLSFDYLLKPGVTRESNALAIARMAGVPV